MKIFHKRFHLCSSPDKKNLSSKYMSDKLTKNYFPTDYKTFLLSSPLVSDDSDDPDYFIDSSQSQYSSQSSQSSLSSQSSQSTQSEKESSQ